MGYIKKLKSNELVGGTDKHTIYPVTSAEAVFEEVSDKVFKSQKYLNNNITNERIVDNTIENRKLKDDTIDMGKLNTQLKTIIQNAYDASWKVKEEPFSLETKYDANDVVYDPDTNSSYVSLTADNQGNPVKLEDEEEVNPYWRMIINGISAIESTEVINAKVEELETEVDNKIDDAQGQLDQMITDAAASLADAESDARGAAAEASAVVANKVADAQIGYFECNTATGTALKQTTFDYIGTGDNKSYYTIPAAGSNVRIKMKYANTAAGTVELQFGSNTATKKQLIYNGEPASQSNSWDDGEVLSIYYDPTYSNNTGAYQASNAMGGGSAVGKKKLTGATGYISTNEDSIGAYNSLSTWRYIKYPVNPGDVVMISGQGGSSPRLYAIARENDTIIQKEETVNAIRKDLVLVMPEEAKWIVLNNNYSTYPNYEWYFAKKESVGAYEMLTEPYLYGDLETLALGQTYEAGTSIKTKGNQLRKITKEIKVFSLSEPLVSGDVRIIDNTTYRAASTINTFNPNTTYAEGAYALGSMAVYTLTVTAESVTAGNISVNETEVAIESIDDAAAIASKIATALVIDGWTTSVADNVVTVKCNTIGNNTTTITITDTDSTGVVVEGSSAPSETGTSVIRKYDGSDWADATVAGMIEDGVLAEVDIEWLLTNASKQNSVVQDINAATTYWEDINIGAVPTTNCGMYYSQSKWWWTNTSNQGKFLPVKAGEVYTIVANGSYEINCGLLKDNTHVEGKVTNFATGETGRIISPNNSLTVTVPFDATYLYFRTIAGSANRTPSRISILRNFHDLRNDYNNHFEVLDNAVEEVEKDVKDINRYPDLILERQPVDLTLYSEQNCSLGSNDKWYYNGSAYGKHKAIEVTSGEIIGINISGFSNGFYGWMTSSYNPPYQSYDNVPYLYNGTGSRRTLYRSDELQYLTVPEGAKYLVICTVDGGNNRVNWEVVKHKSEYRHNDFVKLRVAHWNIGHFATGSGSSTSITPENYDEMSAKYKQVINDLGADILGLAEYDPVFCTDGKLAKDVIFQCYSNIYEGTKYDYNCNTIMFNGLKHIANRQVHYTNYYQRRYAKIVDVLINGRPVRIVETHWDFNGPQGVDAADIKRNQATQLLNLVKDYEYVIIEGDLNTYDTIPGHSHSEKDAATLQMFKDAGFEFVNNGYLDPFITTTDGCSIDHIMAKGFAMSNRQRVDVSGTLSDHYAIYCDLVMNF